MLDVTLPELPARFDVFGGCVITKARNPDFLEWVRENTHDSTFILWRDEPDDRLWLALDLEEWEDSKVHLHVEVSCLEPKTALKEGFSGDDFVKAITKCAEFIAQEQQSDDDNVFVQARAQLSIRRADLPSDGMISTVLGVTGESCGSLTRVTAATIRVEDDAIRRIEVKYDEDADSVMAQLWAICQVEIDDDYLATLAELMEVGAECFVYERSSSEMSNA